jgi:hypothetical protein
MRFFEDNTQLEVSGGILICLPLKQKLQIGCIKFHPFWGERKIRVERLIVGIWQKKINKFLTNYFLKK